MAKRIRIPDSVRQYVFDRDRWQCQGCGINGKENASVKLQVDHIIPLSKNGSNDLSNLQTLCESCNKRKSNRYDHRFRRRFT